MYAVIAVNVRMIAADVVHIASRNTGEQSAEAYLFDIHSALFDPAAATGAASACW